MKYISFLGVGPEGDGYSELAYQMDGRTDAVRTEFVQRAEIEFLGSERFTHIYILCTQKSFKVSYNNLYDELRDDLNIDDDIIEPVTIKGINDIDSAWAFFAKVNQLIAPQDELVIDLTHGFRSLSIILSTALNYILKAKPGVRLRHVFYGEMGEPANSDTVTGVGRIIDMKDFFTVHEWADGVSRLTEIADADKLAQLADCENNQAFQNLKDHHLIQALTDLTATLKNIDVNRIARNTGNALAMIRGCQEKSTGIETDLLKLIENKFLPLEYDSNAAYNTDYFHLQLEIIRMLNQHKLYMQSFTVMRELIGSIGMLGAPENLRCQILDNAVADQRRLFAELFVRMMRFRNFQFTEKEKDHVDCLTASICRKLEQAGLLEELKRHAKTITGIRDGFDHAWTAIGDKSLRKYPDIGQTAHSAHQFFETLIHTLIDNHIIQTS